MLPTEIDNDIYCVATTWAKGPEMAILRDIIRGIVNRAVAMKYPTRAPQLAEENEALKKWSGVLVRLWQTEILERTEEEDEERNRNKVKALLELRDILGFVKTSEALKESK